VVATVEEHGLVGGLGSAVAEWRADVNAPFRLLRFGTEDRFLERLGSQAWARAQFGLTAERIAATVGAAL
jgi:transketolase